MKALIICILCLLACATVTAQHGGKAEPQQIRFTSGASSSTVTGKLSNGEEHDFVFSATKGQKVTIRNSRTSLFDFRVFNEEFNFETEFESSPALSFVVPETGDYLFFVRKKMTAPRAARFSLTLTIK
jgi:hypothetical protein